MNKPFNCKICKRSFINVSNLRRHNTSFHTEIIRKYECWHCAKLFARKENARKHALTVHKDPEQKTVAINARNKRWKPEIFKPEPWTPPQEARPKGTIYQINISSRPKEQESHIKAIKKKIRNSRLNKYIALTPEEAVISIESKEKSTIGKLNHRQILKDLEISPSSSTETILQDEIQQPEVFWTDKPNRVYGIFN